MKLLSRLFNLHGSQSDGLQDIKNSLGKRKTTAIASAALLAAMLIIPAAIKLTPAIKNNGIELNAPVARGKHNVRISADGKTFCVKAEGCIADALDEAGIRLDRDDITSLPKDAPITCDLRVNVSRVDVVENVTLKTIDYKTEYKPDENYVLGYSKVVVDGEKGEIKKIVQSRYVDGKISSAKVLSTDIKEPVNEVVVKGTSEVNPIEEQSVSQLDVPADFELDENGVPVSYTKVLTGKSCAYSASPSAYTASGLQVKVGYVAVDPKIIPYGTKLYIVSTDGKYIYGYAIAADTGVALLDGRILVDLFMGSYEDSVQWGAKQVNIYILE